MDTSIRRRSEIPTEKFLEIAARIKSTVYSGHKIRYLDANEERWVVFSDICKALGYKNPNHESKKVDPMEKCRLDVGLKNTLAVCINQRGLLRFTLFANNSKVTEFLAWAKSEIFSPQINKTAELNEKNVEAEILRLVKRLTLNQKRLCVSYLYHLAEEG